MLNTLSDVVEDAVVKLFHLEVRPLFLQGGLARIKANLSGSVKKGRMKQEAADAVFGRITGTLTYDDFKRADMVIEAAIEVRAVQHQLLPNL